MTASGLVLDPDHRYWLDGQRLPGVTEILTAAGLVDMTWCPPSALVRGSAVHRGMELHLLGVLDWSTVDERIKGYLSAGIQFCEDAKVKEVQVERKVLHRALIYAGRADLICEAFGRPAVIDFKSGAKGHAGLQTAAYENAYRSEVGGHPRRRMAVQLGEDGKHKVTEYTDANDYLDWAALVRLYHRLYARMDKDGSK